MTAPQITRGTARGTHRITAQDVTVLMPVWRGDRPDRFRAALRSATGDQTAPPAELLVVVDGPVGSDLADVLHAVEDGEFGPARVLRAPEHRGLAPTLQEGLEAVRTAYVARADADDLCRPERLELQIRAVRAQPVDLLGGAMQEFSEAVPRGTGPLRVRPLHHQQIVRYLRGHSPFHHPTVMMRADAARDAGGYRDLPLLEDYWLWERMILAGARCANLPDVLVDYRVDADLFARRGGLRLLRSDLRLQRILHRDGVISAPRMLLNLGHRAAYRLAPWWLRRWGYRVLVEGRAPARADGAPGAAEAGQGSGGAPRRVQTGRTGPLG
ncbi:glycosyltransferase [Brachybacterium sp. EF45031]|uniref:glycosyltransferase n=1 Tax=Brachybacterium sillae TaxID=2810536 RepID=UPI00217E56B4|nr:glycosyltransferase [Brachybacterium sillae]MCS6711032.1 glycosyltransferase [Brachybacterium sillae]